ncbi:hypothetical protein TRFO_05973 [Tritrichomonas foetus]|uniref:Uncharacterized protein n=1 Tax=Tritrichomonas foetus TaxID=1144522 RepID=A0A1J4K6P4_9EUKA|nr:hypothetical protein TRFO_05973 [Tritrichomonas foetus]|eukprot:OHT05382.1 hypothetical protein TRFO_05973 [Tritrichomonas foetus]
MTEVMTGDVNFELVKEDIDIQNYEAQDTENPQIKLALPESQIINNQNGADNGNIDNVEESKQYETNHNVENTKTESPNILNRNGDDSKGTEKEDIKNEKVNGDQNNNSNTVSEFIPNFNENNINFTNNDENDEKPLTFDDNKATFSDANDEDEEVLFQLVDEDDENNKI